ncbi:ATPase F0F1 [Leptospira perolatii]|uniref:ATPase F0F1 n=1 Tax=Leptospira perolatii TaxID=2023191 RepID=A0A2M9ZNA0_9LEPT|nr:AtpZ/AtpI family protein [Leptospira perolatii]PJZ68704.1 ATPase F0F1 [Leptospira perolatii]PJZ73540.1 ATPase F0F1 [Leptospira perolatii]
MSSDPSKENSSEKDKEPKPKKEKSAWELASLGMEFCFIVGGSIFLGNYLDSRFSISPFGILGGLALGFSYGIYYILYRVSQFENKDK